MTPILFRCAVAATTAALIACGSDAPAGPQADPPTSVATVTITGAHGSIAVGATMQLSANAANAAGTILVGKAINWVSSRPAVATITSLGLVTGVAVGTTVVTATSEGHSATTAITVQAPNKVSLTSDAGDFIGGGRAYTYTKADALINLTASATGVHLTINGDETWNGDFQVPSGVQLSATTYSNAVRYPFQGSGAGLSWFGDGRGCNTSTGSFTIDSVAWAGAVGSSLVQLDMHFDQHCEGGSAALRGTIHWRPDDPTTAPGPVNPPPSGLWQPPAGATPASGDYLYIQSDQGDFIGGGRTVLIQTGVVASGSGTLITVSGGGFGGTLKGMSSIATLQVGYYGNLERYPFNNPFRGGMDWSSGSSGCNSLSGYFVIDRIAYSGTAMIGIQGRFEQHCEQLAPALHGAFRWGQLPN